MWAKQSTAATLIVGPVLDSAGAEYTSAVIGDLSISKNGGTLTALAAAATLTHIANGQYTLVMTTGNLDTLGRAQITCNKSTYQMPPIGLVVVPAMVFDSLVLGTDVLQSDVIQFGGTAGTFAAGVPTVVLDSAAILAVADQVWDEATSGHTTAGTYGGRIVRATNSNTEVQITGGNHIAADIHNLQSGVITAGDFAANAITASALATDAVTEIQSGLATAAALATESTKITAIETFATRMTTGLVADGAVYQFTPNMLELAPAGDASQATLLEVKAKTDLIGTTSGISSLLAASVLTPGTITEFPDTLTIGDSYTTANGRSIQIPIVDTDGNQISSTGSLNFADATATFVIKRAKETDSTRIITGTAAFTDPVGTGTSDAPYAVVQLTSSETAKGLIGYKYSGVLTFTWPYVGTGTDPEVMSFETDTLLFDN